MDTGTWTFRCQECESAFELLLTERERAGDRRHLIIGYRAQNPRPFIL